MSSCKKDTFITSGDAILSISADTVKFDTVFTSTGSITQSFKVFNNNRQKLLISSIKLMGSPASAYSLNIDGTNTNELTGIEIAANDSIYVFVTVRIQPTNNNLPFIISDSISIQYNGNQRYVQLEAYGQNAHFLNHSIITGNEIWNNDLPYVILGSLQIDTTATLQINSGTKIYVHANAPIWVDGTLQLNGTVTEPVIFRGDRLDDYYKDIPGGWPGIQFRNTSKDNFATHAIFKNARKAIFVQSPSINAQPKLILHQCIIDNAFETGIHAIHSRLVADNTLISNCANNIKVEGGGIYNFTHCTLASYTTSFLFHTKPGVSLTNAFMQNGSVVTNDLVANFTNCIIWGDNNSLQTEIEVIKEGNTLFDVQIDHSLIKAQSDPPYSTLTSILRNEDPLFDSIDTYNKYFNFRLNNNPASPVIDQGTVTPLLKDLDDNDRNIVLPDLGCYEKQ